MLLEIKNISKSYGGVKVLDDFSVEFTPKNQIVCVQGESGSGKTTLLSIIGGLERPDRGTVKINGFEAKRPKDFSSINYVPCDGGLLDALSVRDNMLFGAGRDTLDREMLDILGQLNISSTLFKYPPELSSGEYKRVQIAKALYNLKKVNLFDEPTSNLDSENAATVRRAIGESAIINPGKLFIIATHDSELLKMADKVIEITGC